MSAAYQLQAVDVYKLGKWKWNCQFNYTFYMILCNTPIISAQTFPQPQTLRGPHVCYNNCWVNDVEHWSKFPNRSSFFLEQIIPKLRETNREEFFVIIFSHAKKNMKILAKQGKFSVTDISSVPWFKKGSFKNDIKIGSESLRQIWAFRFLLCCYSSCCMIIN